MFNVVKNDTKHSRCYNDSKTKQNKKQNKKTTKKALFDLSANYLFAVIQEKIGGQICGATGVKKVKITSRLQEVKTEHKSGFFFFFYVKLFITKFDASVKRPSSGKKIRALDRNVEFCNK